MEYKQIILNKLLDKYEKSKSYLENVNRRIILKMEEIKQYDIEDYQKKQIFHDEVQELQQKGIIQYCWEKYEENNILKEIWLQKENVEKAYKEINRKNPKDKYKEVEEILQKHEFKKDWIKKFQQDILKNMEKSQKEDNLLPMEKAEMIEIALEKIDQMEDKEEVLKRVFSIQCYHDSKYFEKNIEKNLLKILKKYYLKEEEIIQEISDDEILAQIGILKAPEVIEFCGNLEGEIDGQKIKYHDITKGSYMNSYTILNIENIQIQADTIILIENKTNYLNYIQNKKTNEFVIYHGGMYSPVKGEFIKKVYQASNTKITKYYHWSDIDIGGFNIYKRLKENIIPEVEPYKMDVQAFLENKENWGRISPQYAHRLEEMLHMEKYIEFYDVIKLMIEYQSRLEQESML